MSIFWLVVVQFLALLFFSFRQEKVLSAREFRLSWSFLSAVIVSRFVFALFRAGNYRNAHDLLLIGIWEDGVGWLLLGLSVYQLMKSLVSQEKF